MTTLDAAPDPHLWLEAIDTPEIRAWVEARNAETLAELDDAQVAADRDALLDALNAPATLPLISRRGGHVYNLWRDAANPRGVWRRTTLAEFRAAMPNWEMVLDLDVLARDEGESWFFQSATSLAPEHRHAMLRLSRGGGDAAVAREFDLVTKRFVAGGFALPEAKGGVSWVDHDTLLVSLALGPDDSTVSGYARNVRLWRRGGDFAQAPIVFSGEPSDMAVWAMASQMPGHARVYFGRQLTFVDQEIHLGTAAGPQERLDLPRDARIGIHRDWLVVETRSAWRLGDALHEPGSLLGISLRAFRAGGRDFSTIFRPGPKRHLTSFVWSGGRLALTLLDDLRSTVAIAMPGPHWTLEPVAGLPDLATLDAWRLDVDESDSTGAFLVNAVNFVTPPSLFLIAPGEPPELLKRGPALFDAQGIVTTRHDAVSSDGARIPYFQVGPHGTPRDAPVLISAYGGFAISLLPRYQPSIGRLWLAKGGTYVQVCARGGGEFGPAWHDQGRHAGKILSHDDVAAVAADLVARGVTRPARIAAEGASNGGLMIGNMLTRYPERFGALWSAVPLLDMKRYTKLLAGASWIAEYGDPDRPEDWAFLATLSAYHNVEAGRNYPPLLLTTTRRDDRVHPGHARKMAAKLAALGHEVLFYEPSEGGHGYGADKAQQALVSALGYAFLRRAIGWESVIARQRDTAARGRPSCGGVDGDGRHSR